MATLYGTQSDGSLIPVQADSQGRLVAELANSSQVARFQEGIWSPSFLASDGGFSATFNRQSGQFFRIGDWVTVQFWVSIGVLTSPGSGHLCVGGLPYAPNSVGITPIYPGFVTLHAGFDLAQDPQFLRAYESDFGGPVRLQRMNAQTGSAELIDSSAVNSDGQLEGSLSFRTDDTGWIPQSGALLV
jgi:hypothetical protein